MEDSLSYSSNPLNSDIMQDDSPEETENNGRWSTEEHNKFLEGLAYFGKNWSKVHKHIGTRSSAQTRSHAQKYFNKLHRHGKAEPEMKVVRHLSKKQGEESTMENSSSGLSNQNALPAHQNLSSQQEQSVLLDSPLQ